jgi:hypothetical protein
LHEVFVKVYKICENKDHTQESKLFDPEKSIGVFVEGAVAWCFEKGNRKKISSPTITKKS